MKNTIRTAKRFFKKAAAFFIALFLEIISSVFNVTSVIYNFISIPLVAMILLVATVSIAKNGYSDDFLPWIAGSILAVGIRFILPVVSSGLQKMKTAAEKKFLSTSIRVKPPVRYTL